MFYKKNYLEKNSKCFFLFKLYEIEYCIFVNILLKVQQIVKSTLE